MVRANVVEDAARQKSELSAEQLEQMKKEIVAECTENIVRQMKRKNIR